MSDEKIKVTDKRMFTADGQLKEEYSFLAEPAAPELEAEAPPQPAAAAPPEVETAFESPLPPGYPDDSRARLDLPGTPPGLGRPTFYDLVSLLAEPIAIYLGDLELPTGESAENLEMARLHIDLLDVLRQKTAGHLSVQEAGFLEDLLYRSRVRYVQKRG
ncbi:MAG TPA: DUF1844 domain-containing protein [Thermoanaerobaculia bacterium]|nr:DUF1844 domain-containing protein [Thermoanaerobaculia bacterium]